MRTLLSLLLLVAFAPAAAAQTAGPPDSLTAGVTAYYPFDVNALDQSGNGNAATQSAAVLYGPGVMGESVSFPTAAAIVTLPDLGTYATSYAIAAWVNWSAGTYQRGDLRTIVSRLYLQPDTGKLQYYFYFDNQNATDNQFVTIVSDGTVPAGGWHHVAVVFNSTDVQLYIDGAVAGGAAVPHDVRAQFPWHRAIGSEGAASGIGTFLNGRIDEVFLYSRALTKAEVQYLASMREDTSGAMSTRSSSHCGNAGEAVCWKCTEHFWWPPLMWGQCRTQKPYCNPPAVFRDQNSLCGAPPEVRAVFSVRALPSSIDIEGYPTVLNGIVGYQATITNANAATFVVGDTRNLGVDCGRLSAWLAQTCTGVNSTQCQSLRTLSANCNVDPPTCATTGIRDNSGNALNYPLYTIQEWQNIYPTRIKINANWFDVNGPVNFPHVSPCTDIYGWSVSNGVMVSPETNGAPTGTTPPTDLLDAFVVIDTPSNGTTTRSLRIVSNAEIHGLQNVKQAVGGFLLVKNGKKVSTFAASTKPSGSGARTGLGLSQDGKTLWIVVVQAGQEQRGMTATELASYMRSLGAYNVLNFDNSGSSQFYYSDGVTRYISLPGDLDASNNPVYRPVPNFLGIQ